MQIKYVVTSQEFRNVLYEAGTFVDGEWANERQLDRLMSGLRAAFAEEFPDMHVVVYSQGPYDRSADITWTDEGDSTASERADIEESVRRVASDVWAGSRGDWWDASPTDE